MTGEIGDGEFYNNGDAMLAGTSGSTLLSAKSTTSPTAVEYYTLSLVHNSHEQLPLTLKVVRSMILVRFV